jgi:hypothetical protein
MRAQLRRGVSYGTRGLTKFEREPGHLHGPMTGVRDRQDHFLRDHLGVGKHVRQVHYHTAGHTSRVQPLNPVGFGSLGDARIDKCIDRSAVLHPEIVGAEIGMFSQGFEIQRREELGIDAVVTRGDGDLTVLRGEQSVWRDMARRGRGRSRSARATGLSQKSWW